MSDNDRQHEFQAHAESAGQESIAIIGMTVRMPGAPNLDAFWRNLRDGVESVSLFSEQELLESGLDLATIRHPNFVPAKAILDDIDLFDASFFGISPREAELMDPQHRLLMECAWSVLEHAGYDSETYGGRIAVFTSAGMNTYLPFHIVSHPGLVEEVGGFQLSMYNDKDFVPTRIAYSMNLKGPGVDIGTACSSSLVSVHFACQHLITYQSDMALVGGITVHLPQKMGHLYEEGTAYSPDSHCRPFDTTRSGLIDGNGMAAVVLKRLEDALADGDHIHAVIKGTAINNDGSLKVGYSAPSIDGQAEVIVEAQTIAGVRPETISYVETHGTATPLGDPIEVAALTQAFRAGTDKTGFCGIGSVKSNIGHVDKAAGLAGLIKTTLALEHEKIPPSLHFEQPNPKLKLAQSPFYVVNRLQDWPRNGHAPRRAGISSFGVGGTNAHTVVEEAPLREPGSASRPIQLVMLSAKTQAALAAATDNLANFLEQQSDTNPELNLADVCYTLQRGRRAFAYRRAVTCRSLADAVTALRSPPTARMSDRADTGLVFLFPGQGSQYPGMGRELYDKEQTFREQIDACAAYLEPELGLDIRTLLFPELYGEGAEDKAAAQLEQTALTQPALFTLEYALAQLWISWGLQPQAMLGHSLGEYVAACVAGVFSLPDALRLVAARGRLMQQLPPGAMLAVPLAEEALRPLLGPKLDLAAVNGPQLCVVSGPESAIEQLQGQLTNQGLACRRLHTSHAFHSAMMEPILEAFTQLLQGVELKPPNIPYVSNVTGSWVTETETSQPSYWAQHLRHTVRFGAGLSCVLDSASPVLLEVGPGRTLSGLAAQTERAQPPVCLGSLPHARQQRGAHDCILQTLADLWSAGVNIDWAGFYRQERRLRVPLPTYPFQRRRYWLEPGKRIQANDAQVARTAKRPDISDWFYLPAWKMTLPPQPAQELPAGPWLMFGDEHGLAEALEAELEQAGHQVIRVRAGEGFAQLDPHTYRLNPLEPADFGTILDALKEQGVVPRCAVHLWGIGESETPEHAPNRACDSLLSLVQALGRLSQDQAIELIVIANRMRDVSGETPIDPTKAALFGPVATIPWEYPQLSCRAIDVSLPESSGLTGSAGQLSSLATRLVRELSLPAANPNTAPSHTPIVALRAQQRWVPTLEPIRLEAPGQHVPASSLLRQGGVYVITGGLDDSGLLFARQVAETVRAAKLILVTTHPLPDGNSQDPGTFTQLQELEALGCEVLPVHIALFDTSYLESVFSQAESRFGRIDGVIHAADMSKPRLFSLMQDLDQTARERYWQEQSRQQHVLTALEHCVQQRAVSFCLLMSSLASEVGGMGQVAHTSTCLYLDAFARRCNQNSSCSNCSWIVINWDVWRAQEQQEQQEQQDRQETYAERAAGLSALAEMAMLPSEGADAFRRIVARSELTRIAVASTPPQLRREVVQALYQTGDSRAGDQHPDGGDAELNGRPAERHERPDLPTAYEPPRNEDEAAMAELWQEFLGIDQVGIHDNFFDLGGHSLLATQLVSRLRQTFQVDVELEIFFSAPSIAELTAVLLHKQLEHGGQDQLSELLDKLEGMSEEEVQALLDSGQVPEELLAALADDAQD